MNDGNHILANRIITPDGTVLQSFHRRDFKSHLDTVTGLTYSVDGGLDYLRRVGQPGWTDDCAYTSDSHEFIRSRFAWGTYGPEGDEPLKYIYLQDMSTEHIEAILQNCLLQKHIRDVFVNELSYRSTSCI